MYAPGPTLTSKWSWKAELMILPFQKKDEESLIFRSTCPFHTFEENRYTLRRVYVGKVNCFVGVNRDCVSASKETLCLYVRVWMCTWVCTYGEEMWACEVNGRWRMCWGLCIWVCRVLTGIDKSIEGRGWLMWKANRSREESVKASCRGKERSELDGKRWPDKYQSNINLKRKQKDLKIQWNKM